MKIAISPPIRLNGEKLSMYVYVEFSSGLRQYETQYSYLYLTKFAFSYLPVPSLKMLC